ncbi:hypothetical protein BH10BAC2_BH10BAC2_16580 [soil metagenome]
MLMSEPKRSRLARRDLFIYNISGPAIQENSFVSTIEQNVQVCDATWPGQVKCLTKKAINYISFYR